MAIETFKGLTNSLTKEATGRLLVAGYSNRYAMKSRGVILVDAHYSVELPQAFVAGEDELKKLASLLSDRIGNLEIRADCADGVARMFTTIEKLDAFENAKGKEIQRLRISSHSDDLKKRATIDLSGSRWKGISLDFEASDDIVSLLRADVLDLITGMQPWYTVLYRVDFVSIAVLAYFILWSILLIVVAFKWLPVDSSKEVDSSNSALAQLVVYGGIALLLAIGIALNRFRDLFFPHAVFSIGQGKARFKHLERIQWGIIIAFIISFAAGVVILVLQAIRA